MAKSWEDLIREAIKKTGKTQYNLSRKSGVSESVISRFMRRKVGITLATAEVLCRALNLDLTTKRVA